MSILNRCREGVFRVYSAPTQLRIGGRQVMLEVLVEEAEVELKGLTTHVPHR